MADPVAARLHQLRRWLGFGRRSDMAAHLGLPGSTYSAYEGEAGPPKVEWLAVLARRGVNLNWLLTGEGEMLAHPTAPAPPMAPVVDDDPAALNTYLLAAMISRVEREQRERGRSLTALEKGEMIAHLYALSARLTESELAGRPLSRAAEAPEK